MRASVITTVYNRDPRVLENMLASVRGNDLSGTEVVIVDDGSTLYEGETIWTSRPPLFSDSMLRWSRIDTKADRPDTYQIDGYNNPAYAWNRALDAAQGDIIIVVGSDCILQSRTLKAARQCGKAVWMCGVVDIDSGAQYLGPQRIAPFGWVMAWNRKEIGDIRWDENYLRGMAFDDNDMTARLGLAAKQIHLDFSITAFHQSHASTAYSDGLYGHGINERYTREKWGGIPWSGEKDDPLRVAMARQGNLHILQVERKDAPVPA